MGAPHIDQNEAEEVPLWRCRAIQLTCPIHAVGESVTEVQLHTSCRASGLCLFLCKRQGFGISAEEFAYFLLLLSFLAAGSCAPWRRQRDMDQERNFQLVGDGWALMGLGG